MILKDLYSNDINRKVNPAVSATDLDKETIETEIKEYVFTEDIVQGLYNIMSAIMKKEKSHDGIWINGYYGSGKSHFLKYLDYCLSPEYGEKAMGRLMRAAEDFDPLQNSKSKLNVTPSEMKDLAVWLKNNTIDTILFNIETVSNSRGNNKRIFLDVLWNELNKFRGYNGFNIALAQYLEKVLDENGKFEEFQEKLKEKGMDWKARASTYAIMKLDTVLDIAKSLVPTLTTDIIRDKIKQDDAYVSVETFMQELKQFIDSKGSNYHLVYLVDETSQFINNRGDLLLQLQEIVTRLHEVCADRVWLGCTAQQDLSELLDGCHILSTSEDYGKIMGRFEVKVSLKGTQPEYITQKRILDKTGQAEIVLGKLYDDKKNAIETQFQLPSGYSSFSDRDNFIAYYPFVPYQFKLMKQVFDSFVQLGFVEREVKGNERSIIKVTHSTAKDTKSEEVGKFISFDQFYNAMFQGVLTHVGQRAIKNAVDVIEEYPENKREFGKRVVNILFMICYLSQTDRLVFPATVDNMINLLMRDVDANRLAIKQDLSDVLAFLYDKNIIRLEPKKDKSPEYYCFYTEDEMQVAQLVKNQPVDNHFMGEVLKNIFFDYMGAPQGRENYCGNRFTISGIVMGRNFLTNNADIEMELVMEDNFSGDTGTYALGNKTNRLSFLIAPLYNADKTLTNDFYRYCQLQAFVKTPAQNEQRQRTIDAFVERERKTFDQNIKKKFRDIFDSCDVVSGTTDISAFMVQTKEKGAKRYSLAMEKHFENMYPYAKWVTGTEFPKSNDALRDRVKTPIAKDEYGPLNPMRRYEEPVERYLSTIQYPEVNLTDIVKKFAAIPYGWSELATLYIVNELVRRRKRDYAYNGDPNVEWKTIAPVLATEKTKITIRPAQAIDRQLIDDFVAAWKNIFGLNSISSVDSSELFRKTKDDLSNYIRNYTELVTKYSRYPFAGPLGDMLALFEKWNTERDNQKYFKLVVADSDTGKSTMDCCKEIKQFCEDQLAKYNEIVSYVENNSDNFNFLDNKGRSAAAQLQGISSDLHPWNSLQGYLKIKREIDNALNIVKKQFCDTIRANYTAAMEYLQTVATENGCNASILPALDSVVTSKTNTSNLYALQSNCNADAFQSEWVERLMKTIPQNPTPPQPNPNASGSEPTPTPQPSTKKTRRVELKTKTTKPLATEADVDNYLNTLRQQLMDIINGGEDVMITK